MHLRVGSMGARTANLAVRIRRRLAPPWENTFRHHWPQPSLLMNASTSSHRDNMASRVAKSHFSKLEYHNDTPYSDREMLWLFQTAEIIPFLRLVYL